MDDVVLGSNELEESLEVLRRAAFVRACGGSTDAPMPTECDEDGLVETTEAEAVADGAVLGSKAIEASSDVRRGATGQSSAAVKLGPVPDGQRGAAFEDASAVDEERCSPKDGVPDGSGGEVSTQSGGVGGNTVKVVVNVGVCSEIVGDGWMKLKHSGSGVMFKRIGMEELEDTTKRFQPMTRKCCVAVVLEILVAIIGE